MELDKIRNMSDEELKQQAGQSAEQLFRLRFNAKLGQTEGMSKVRALKKDVARIKTIARQRELGIADSSKPAAVPTRGKKTRKESR